MADFAQCPTCGRKARNALSSNHFPVYRCRKCRTVYCKECATPSCPRCGSDDAENAGKVFAR
ncbi:MAG TPA: hypothetical protein PLW83_01135 [Deltaproteobacteria bacterium]|nr:hypothetical protein [Deltaproteobacteria bacterium]